LDSAAPDASLGQPWQLYATLSTAVVITDAQGRIVYLNPRAEAFWGVALVDVADQVAWDAFCAGPSAEADAWVRSVLLPALDTGTTAAVSMKGADGRDRAAEIGGVWITEGDQRFAVFIVTGDGIGPAVTAPPEWALRDPLTGLHNLHHWHQQFAEWNARTGAVVFFDLDGLKEINDLSGHRAGDKALAITGRAIAAEAPAGALLVRYGGDEFVMVVDPECAPGLRGVAQRTVTRAAEAAEAAEMSLLLHLSFGIAEFTPGGLDDAVHRADDAMYEHKGVLMRGTDAGRIVLTRAGRNLVRKPGTDPEDPRPGTFAASFGPEFDGYFRQTFARAAEHAREFVEFVAPRAGQAVVEVGAGSGRIAFDGGLAERIGPGGQLLLTDPSAAQLQVARKRAQELGLGWVRFLQAPAEDIPLASGTVDLVLGSTFLHFTDPVTALKSMARIIRPGGRVAVHALLELRFGNGWDWPLEPVKQELRAHGLPFRDFLAPRSELEAAYETAGLKVDRVAESQNERAEYPHADLAVGVMEQTGLARLFLRGVPQDRVRIVAQMMKAGIREGFGQPGFDWSWTGRWISMLSHRPA